MFALVDANSFYCSAEQVFRPDWRNKPIVVLSNNDGCVVAVNRLAKEAGIPKFEAYFKVKALCELKNVIVLSSNYDLYANLSMNMMNVIGRFAPEQNIYSIDESFLSFDRTTHAIPCLTTHGRMIRRAIWKECRLPVCVGFGETLTLSKVANRIAKSHRSYNGVCVIDSEKARIEHLGSISASDVWGVGRRLSEQMKFMGINTALDLARLNPSKARKEFNINVERTVRELNGVRCLHWDNIAVPKKQIYSTRSVGERITNLHNLTEAIAKHCGIASRKARNQQSLCRTMVVFAGNSPFDARPLNKKMTHQFAYPTADVTAITKVASELAKQIFAEGIEYYKVGVGLIELVSGDNEQGDLFNPHPNNNKLMNVFDGLNSRFGGSTLFLASQGIEQKWDMRREHLTPSYTSDWKSLPKIKC
ncbi:Y-family DNA polymerase [Vibrio coralliirubri]|uniref:Y-family DNA polymerase n=1 Tax=Vibrio coralliirubri TaxID=1516159 RepID=UPI0022847103|nr:Y-family DNA polymerase [Vibrio coralliirubri]MCY9861109.1 Y-family DNA polymerase [Vibrio coralliirubri]